MRAAWHTRQRPCCHLTHSADLCLAPSSLLPPPAQWWIIEFEFFVFALTLLCTLFPTTVMPRLKPVALTFIASALVRRLHQFCSSWEGGPTMCNAISLHLAGRRTQHEHVQTFGRLARKTRVVRDAARRGTSAAQHPLHALPPLPCARAPGAGDGQHQRHLLPAQKRDRQAGVPGVQDRDCAGATALGLSAQRAWFTRGSRGKESESRRNHVAHFVSCWLVPLTLPFRTRCPAGWPHHGRVRQLDDHHLPGHVRHHPRAG